MIRSEAGFSIIQVLIFIGILTVMSLQIVQMSVNRQREVLGGRAVSSRDAAFDRVRFYAAVPSALVQSSALVGNPMFKKCVFGIGAGVCDATTTTGLILTEAPPSTVQFAGPENAPVLLSEHGEPCATVSESCIIEVIASFRPECAGGAASCATAQGIHIEFKVRQTSTYNLRGFGNLAEKSGFVDLTVAKIQSESP